MMLSQSQTKKEEQTLAEEHIEKRLCANSEESYRIRLGRRNFIDD